MTGKLLMACGALVALLTAPAWGQTGTEEVVKSAGEQTQAAAAAGRVERAVFTTAVVEREPQDTVDTLTSDNTQIFFFTELRDLEGETLTHRWEWNGQVMAEVPLSVGGPRWRTYSSKNLDPSWLGEWTVSVVDASDRILSSASFTYTPVEQEASAAAAPAAVE